MEMRRQRILFIVCFIFAASFVFIRLASTTNGRSSITFSRIRKTNLVRHMERLPPANASLGFGAIVALSRPGSSRRAGLLAAANITELDIVITEQPEWTDRDVEMIKATNNTVITRGSALAWLGHLHILRWFLSTGLETVLILEDDVDWDIRLRSVQIPRVASSIRHLTTKDRRPGESAPSTDSQVDSNEYWGPSKSWDLLYLGHCGDFFQPSSWNFRVPRTAYRDETMPDFDDLHPYTKKFLQALNVPPGVRLVHKSISPLCTFGFALTRSAAKRMLNDIAPKEANGGTVAYDVRMLEACRDFGLRCFTANPELFHHMDIASEIADMNKHETGAVGSTPSDDKSASPHQGLVVTEANVASARGAATDPKQAPVAASRNEGDEADKGKGAGIGTDDEGRLQSPLAGRAPNIRCGARSRTFYTKSEKTLEFLREVVGRQGQCLRDMVEEDMARSPVKLDTRAAY